MEKRMQIEMETVFDMGSITSKDYHCNRAE